MNIKLLIREDESHLSSLYTFDNLLKLGISLPVNIIVVSNNYLKSIDIFDRQFKKTIDDITMPKIDTLIVFENSDVLKASNAVNTLRQLLTSEEYVKVDNDLIYINYDAYLDLEAGNYHNVNIKLKCSKIFTRNPFEYMKMRPIELDYVIKHNTDKSIRSIILVKPLSEIINTNK